MSINNTEFNKALKEIELQKERYDKLYREFCSMKLYAETLREEIESLKKTDETPSYMTQADEAMKRYTAKLRKEMEDAKQEQS